MGKGEIGGRNDLFYAWEGTLPGVQICQDALVEASMRSLELSRPRHVQLTLFSCAITPFPWSVQSTLVRSLL